MLYDGCILIGALRGILCHTRKNFPYLIVCYVIRPLRGGYYSNSATSTQKGYWFDKAGSYYLGVKFNIGANTHYGWIELECVDADPGANQLTIKAYGYNPTADAAIKAGFTPNAVDLAGVQASGDLQTIAASAFAALGGALTWLRRKLRRS